MSILLQNASPEHRPILSDLLQSANLTTSDLPADLSGFTLAFEGEQLVGSAGIEPLGGQLGLLRSVAVAESHRNRRLGGQLFDAALDFARSQSLQSVYLITNTADQYFEKHGFKTIERSAVPPEIAQTEQFSGLCPASSVVMKLDLL